MRFRFGRVTNHRKTIGWFLFFAIVFILPLPIVNPHPHVLRFYYVEGCPHAMPILNPLQTWIGQQSLWELYLDDATPYLPSPTLRISQQEGFTNYIGSNAIKDAIETNVFMMPFP